MQKIQVTSRIHNYEVIIGQDILSHLQQLPYSQFTVITDSNVAKHHLSKLEVNFDAIIIEPGENSKSFATLERILNKFCELKLKRNSCVIALGGGMITDLAGFAASIYMRGIKYINIPTSLLGQIDASIGGKTAINNNYGKNLIGSFYPPILTLCDIDLLSTLPQRELVSGYSELIKYGLINNQELYSYCENNLGKILQQGDALLPAVEMAVGCKLKVVSADETEQGQRSLLNFGHSFGHAIEKYYNYELLHGEAVAIGMVLAFKFSTALGLCSNGDAQKIEKHIAKAGLPTKLSKVDLNKFINFMRADKKLENDKFTLILTRGIGKAFIAKDIEYLALYNFLLDNLQ